MDTSRRKLLQTSSLALLLCALPGPLVAQEDTRTQEEVAKACQEKVREVHARMQRLKSEGRYSQKIHDTMHAEFFPNMQAGKYGEAEQVADRVLAVLRKGMRSDLSESAGETIDIGLKVGDKIPDFELPDQTGQPRDFDSLKGPKGLLLVFHRSADW